MFYSRLEELCKSKGLTITDFSKRFLGASDATPTGWKNGKRPRIDYVIKAAEYFDVSVDFLLCLDDVPNRRRVAYFSMEEKKLIDEFRSSPPHMKKVILAIVRAAIDASLEDTDEGKVIPVSTVWRSIEGIVAAGAVLFDKPIEDERIEIPAKYGDEKRYYVLKVRGDSMEPRIPNGACLVVDKEDQPLNGQIGVVAIEGDGSDFEYAVKEVHYRQQTKEIELHSFNEAYDVKTYPLSRVKSVEHVEQIILPR